MTWAQPGEPPTINRLRLRSRAPDRLATQLRAAGLIERLSFQPSDLTGEAILCVRTLRDPRPGLLNVRRPSARATQDWERAVAEALNGLARRAARPAAGAVPANAEAVIFADRSEWLACLALDWRQGQILEHWWWQGVMRNREPGRVVVESWRQWLAYVPAAVVRLERRGQAAAAMEALGEPAVREMALELTRHFGMREVYAGLEGYQPLPATVRPAVNGEDRATHEAMPPPWAGPVEPKAGAAESVWGQTFIGVALMLHSAPSRVRSNEFARQVRAWMQAVGSVRPPEPAHAIELPAAPTRQIAGIGRLARGSKPLTTLSAEASAEPLSQTAEPDATTTAASTEPPGRARPGAMPGRQTLIAAALPLEPADSVEIDTAFAGCLYLVNLGLFMGLYGDFTTPLAPGIDLPIWDFVALAALELLGEALMADPLWSLLARLAGRAEGEPPGHGFAPPNSATLRDWLDELMVGVRARLCLALGAEAEGLGGFFQARGRIVVNTARLNAFLALAELPIEVRLCGLDRDPGWVPAAGRTILFHFD